MAKGGEKRMLEVALRVWRLGLGVLACLVLTPWPVYAHGMGGRELGPPVVVSGLLGFVSYWLVMLWPSGKRKGGTSGRPNRTFLKRNPPTPSTRIKQKPRLRIIEARGPSYRDRGPGRKAIDG